MSFGLNQYLALGMAAITSKQISFSAGGRIIHICSRLRRRKWQLTPVFLLDNPRDGRAWWLAVYEVTQSRTQLKWLCRSSSSTNSESPLRATCSLQAHMQSRRCNHHHGAHFPDEETEVKRLDQAHTAKHVNSQGQTQGNSPQIVCFCFTPTGSVGWWSGSNA